MNGIKKADSQDQNNALPLQDFSLASAQTKEVRDLGSLVQIELMQGGGDSITSAEKSSAISTASMLIDDPGLPPGDKDLLTAWLANVATITTTTPNLEISGAQSPDVQALGQQAEAALQASTASGGPPSLTTAQIESFLAQANVLIGRSDISLDDKLRLGAWIGQVASFAPLQPPITDNTPSSVGVSTLARHNPYEDPSLMAIIGPMMNELAKAMNTQILSSATMAILFMQVSLAMAQETAAAEIAKANVDAEQQRKEAEANMVAAQQAKLQGILAITSPLASIAMQKVALAREGIGWNRRPEGADKDAPGVLGGKQDGILGFIARRADIRTGEDLSRDTIGSERYFSMRQTATQNTKAVVEGAFNAATQFVTANAETAKADIKIEQAGLTEQAGNLQAAISVLQALISSMQKMTEDMRESGKAALQNFQSQQDLARDIARTSRGIGQRG